MPYLEVRTKEGPETIILETAPVTIGRHPSNQMRLEDKLLSRRHCVVERLGESWRIRDLGSRNGIRVNGQRCAVADLSPGDEIRLGNIKIRFLDAELHSLGDGWPGIAARFGASRGLEIDLGQDELVDDVLTVDIHEVAAQYLASVYATTPLPRRAAALSNAIDAIEGITSFWEPIGQMESVSTSPLPDLDAFLPHWVKQLRRSPSPVSEWENVRDRWLREAVLRLEGVAGLERLARRTRQPEALRAWCNALVDREDWSSALAAYDDAAELVGKSPWRGDRI